MTEHLKTTSLVPARCAVQLILVFSNILIRFSLTNWYLNF